MTQTMQDALEAMVDQTSLSAVLEALQEIAHGKADHLESNWQDHAAARQWTRAGREIDKCKAKVETLLR